MALLVMMGDDLGTTFMLLIIFLALLWIIGTPGRLMLGMLAIIGLVLLIMIVVEPWRLKRLTGYAVPGPVGEPAEHPGQVGGGLGRLVRRGPRRQPGNGAGSRNRRPTSSSRSWARNSAWSARCA